MFLLRRLLLCALGVAVGTYAIPADEDSRAEKVRRLLAAQGVEESFERELEYSRRQAEHAARQVLREVSRQLVLDDRLEARLEAAFIAFTGKLEAPWSAGDVSSVWARLYGSRFTDEEIDALLQFYTSDLGQKEVHVAREALAEFAIYFQQEGERILRPALEEYVEELETIVRECDCRKTKAASPPP